MVCPHDANLILSLHDIFRRLPMARVWPPSKFGIDTQPQPYPHIDLPPQNIQDELIDLYFINIHPVFPVIHKTRFLSEYNSRKQRLANALPSITLFFDNSISERQDFRDSPGAASTGSTYSSPRPEPTQEVTRLLLFSMFAVAARYVADQPPAREGNKMWDAGYEYLDHARKILSKQVISRVLGGFIHILFSKCISYISTVYSAGFVALGV